MKSRWFIFAASAILLCACAVDSEYDVVDELEVVIEVLLEESKEGTKTTLQNDGTTVYWEDSEVIKVFQKGIGYRFSTYEYETGVRTGTNFYARVAPSAGFSHTDPLWGIYPYREDTIIDGESIITTLPYVQQGREGSFAKDTHISLGKREYSDWSMLFYSVCGGLRFSLSQEGITKVVLKSNNGESLAGTIKVSLSDGRPVVNEVSNGSNYIALNAPKGEAFKTGVWYYFEVIPGTLSEGFQLSFYKGNSIAEKTIHSSVTFKRRIYGSLPNVDNGLEFSPTGNELSDEPIVFADPGAKYACLERFDTNYDDELSYKEAAAATSIEGLFTNWSGVVSFDEFQYFSNVNSTVNVFEGLKKLERVTLPESIVSLGSFEGCSALNTISLPNSIQAIPENCFKNCTKLASISLPAGIQGIPRNCFSGCTSLQSLSVPSSVISISEYAFSGCNQLSSINFPESLKVVSDYAFYNCSSLIAVQLPDGLNKVGSFAFNKCSSLSDVSIGNNVSIGSSAFRNCAALNQLAIGEGAAIDSYAFSESGLISVSIPSGSSLADGVFAKCSSLVSATLPNNLEAIPPYLFDQCSSLATITWPSSVTSIGDFAFRNCPFVDNDYTLELPPTIKTIGICVFSGIRHLIVPSTSLVTLTRDSGGRDSFSASMMFIYVPASKVDMYKYRNIWCDYADWIKPISDYPCVLTVGGQVAEAVDLGVSVKWASWNIGASAPEQYGAYLAWGETVPNWEYSWLTYKWCNGSYNSLTKYNNDSWYGNVDNKRVLDLEDDAANVNWGEGWRMPTSDEWSELVNNCKVEMTSLNGVNGLRFTSKIDGFTDKSIFIPEGYYWHSKCAYGSNAMNIYFYHYNSSSYSASWQNSSARCNGYTVRPVFITTI